MFTLSKLNWVLLQQSLYKLEFLLLYLSPATGNERWTCWRVLFLLSHIPAPLWCRSNRSHAGKCWISRESNNLKSRQTTQQTKLGGIMNGHGGVAWRGWFDFLLVFRCPFAIFGSTFDSCLGMQATSRPVRVVMVNLSDKLTPVWKLLFPIPMWIDLEKIGWWLDRWFDGWATLMQNYFRFGDARLCQ